LKSDDKAALTQQRPRPLRETFWWIPVLWRFAKWLRKRSKRKSVTRIRIRRDEEVIIKKKDSTI
jgi:hypothetical protein